MKTKRFLTAALIIMYALTTTMFTACTSDDDDNPAQPSRQDVITVNTASLYEKLGIAEQIKDRLSEGKITLTDTILIYDQTGMLVSKLGAESSTLDSLTFKTTDLSDGTYTLVVWQSTYNNKGTRVWYVSDEEQLSTVGIKTSNGSIGFGWAIGYASASVTVKDGIVGASVTPEPMVSIVDVRVDNYPQDAEMQSLQFYCYVENVTRGFYLDPSRSDADRWQIEADNHWEGLAAVYPGESGGKYISLCNDISKKITLYGKTPDGKRQRMTVSHSYETKIGDDALIYFDYANQGKGVYFGAPDSLSTWLATPFGDMLKNVENIVSIEAFAPMQDNVGFTECYEVFFRQPVDHGNPAAGTMQQKALIFFKGFDRPTVMYTRGYDVPDIWKNNKANLDIAANMDANLIIVEHRYFGDSKNLSDTRWDYLTIEQAAADHHAIFQAMKPLLPKEWISSGTSKDGMTSLFYRYFYPNDMTVTTVFCAPFMTSLHYTPIGTYLDCESGSDAERENMHAIHFKLLEGKEDGIGYKTYVQMCEKYDTKVRELSPETNYSLFNNSFEYYLAQLSHFFFDNFSYYTAKDRALNIPSADADMEVILDYIYFRSVLTQNGLWKYDSPLAPAAEEEDYYWKANSRYPYYIQTAKQLGQLCYDYSRYESLIGEVPQNPNPSGLFEQDCWLYGTYDNTRIRDIRENFLPTTECPILFYYAKSDPWTGARPDKINESNTMLLIGQTGIHNQDLNNPEHFSQDDKQQIMDFLARYVDYENATTKARRRSGAKLPTAPIEPDRFIIR